MQQRKQLALFTLAHPSLRGRALIMAKCVFKQIAIHPDTENCITESNVHEPVTILKHFNARATKKLITLRKKNYFMRLKFSLFLLFFY